MNIFDVFFQANILVQISILILIIFSMISWSIIFYRVSILKIELHKLRKFENKFWSGIELPKLYHEISLRRNRLNSSEQIFHVGFREFSRLYQKKHCFPETITNRIFRVMCNSMNSELEELEKYIPLIGTIGSISPYIGLFGTVLGIIHVFFELNKTVIDYQIINIQIIAPGIAESLISTAIGLFVAIPAVIAFNYLTVQINNLDQNYNNFIEEFIAILYRQVFLNNDSVISKEKEYEENTDKKTLDTI